MSSNKIFWVFFATALLFAVFTLRCDDNRDTYNPLGVWELDDFNGLSRKIMKIEIRENETYFISGDIGGETETMTVLTESGTWEQDGRKLYLRPNECRKIDFELGALVLTECYRTTVYVICENTLEDGEVILKKKE